MLRVLTGLSIYWVLIPGYAAALIMSRFVPPVFVGIAFDSGGVASGPMTSTFLLPLAMGACGAVGGNVVTDAFGIVALGSPWLRSSPSRSWACCMPAAPRRRPPPTFWTTPWWNWRNTDMAATQKRTPCLRLLLSVTQAEDEHRVVEVLQKNGIPFVLKPAPRAQPRLSCWMPSPGRHHPRAGRRPAAPAPTSRRCSGPSTRRFLTTSAAQASP